MQDVEGENETALFKKVKSLSPQLQSEIMTLAQRFELIGREKGHEEGRAEGCKDSLKEVAQKLAKSGFDNSKIKEITGLSLEEMGVV